MSEHVHPHPHGGRNRKLGHLPHVAIECAPKDAEYNDVMDGDRTGSAIGPTGARPIEYWFRVARIPDGGAPLAIRERWIGVVLPVRRPRPIEGPEPHVGHDVSDRRIVRPVADGVAVELNDAMTALRFFGEDEAARWWEVLLRQRPLTSALLFRRAEGELMPPSLARLLHPELDDLEGTLSA